MDKALLGRVENQAWFHRYPRGVPLALFAVGLITTCLFVLNLESANDAAIDLELQSDSAALVNEIEGMASENIAYLNAAASMFSLSDEVGQKDLAQFVSDMSVDYKKRGVLGVGWARWMKPAGVAVFEAQSRIDDGDPIQINPRPVSPQQDMAVIALLEPLNTRNSRALGYDMNSDPLRRQAMELARRSGEATASAKVQLIQDRGDAETAGTLIYVAVFQRQFSAASDNRPKRLKGYVFSPIRAQDYLLAATANVHRDLAHAALYDGPAVPSNLLATVGTAEGDRPTLSQPVEFAGRKWTLVVASQHSGGLTMASMLVLLLGLLISLLISVLAWQATTRAADDRRVLEWLSRQAAIRTSLTRELNHRVKNTLANVLSIVSLTKRRSETIDEFADSLTGRIRALSATHDLLSTREWRDAPLRDVVISELAPYLDPADPHAEFEGPDVLLAPNDALSLGLALHELATNAAKYGALSVPEGRVSVNWSRMSGDRCQVIWRERGGPPVSPPSRRGFGLELVEKIVTNELKAPVQLRFDPQGVYCILVVPLRGRREFTLRDPG